MDYFGFCVKGPDVVVEGVKNFSADNILDCGQCFRWQREGEGVWRGVVAGKARTVIQQGDTLILKGADEREFTGLWHDYFDFGRDYDEVKAVLRLDPAMRRAVEFTPGMRVLRQPPWETLCSFIISANNNILRIRGIVERLCGLFGVAVEGGFAFPEPERLAVLSPDDLAPVRLGYRAAYIIDAARRVAGGELELEPLYTLPLPEARKRLLQVKGVGPKVAECVLLYGFSRAECVPVDVWIKRVLDAHYPDGMPPELTAVAGLGQQFLFHYVRNCPGALDAVTEKEEVLV